jgi:AcrR family transcriptional regulator
MSLDQLAGRPTTARADAARTRLRLIDAVAVHVEATGAAPQRLADVARVARISTATAYRYFESVDDVVQAHVLRLPEDAARQFHASLRAADDPEKRLLRWNRAWTMACLDFGPTAIHLRSTEGFLARRRSGDPVVAFVCRQVEPLLGALTRDVVPSLAVWNAVSDPREVLDLRGTLRWSAQRITQYVHAATVAAL